MKQEETGCPYIFTCVIITYCLFIDFFGLLGLVSFHLYSIFDENTGIMYIDLIYNGRGERLPVIRILNTPDVWWPY